MMLHHLDRTRLQHSRIMPQLIAPEFSAAQTRLQSLRKQLLDHPLYAAVNNVAALRCFMEQHVFAVWDFMSLLKRLQHEVTCISVPWQPPADAESCRFVTEILLAEECDEDGQGGHASHFELYLAAMRDLQADTATIEDFLNHLARDGEPATFLERANILPETRQFVRFTLDLASHGQPWSVAAAFFHGREDVIPDMFSRLVSPLEREGLPIDRFLHYLRRHIEVDGDQHGPLADRLLQRLCADNPQRELESMQVAGDALQHRLNLWNGILASLP